MIAFLAADREMFIAKLAKIRGGKFGVPAFGLLETENVRLCSAKNVATCEKRRRTELMFQVVIFNCKGSRGWKGKASERG